MTPEDAQKRFAEIIAERRLRRSAASAPVLRGRRHPMVRRIRACGECNDAAQTRPSKLFRNLNAKIASIPMILTALVRLRRRHGLDGRLFLHQFQAAAPLNFVGLDQYERLWASPRWLVSIENLAIYGVLSLIFSLVIGFLLAALLDQKIRFENTFRTIFLYPFALSFIVTGLVWQWILNPDFGVQHVVRGLGWTSFTFDPLYNADIVIYGILIAGPLAGHRPHHVPDAGRPARHRRGHLEGRARRRHPDVEDLSLHRHSDDAAGLHHHAGDHRQRHRQASTTSWSRRPAAVRASPPKCRPNTSTTIMFRAQNLGQGFAASTMMLLTVAIVVVPWAYLEFGRRR